jgi:hypothetical protein
VDWRFGESGNKFIGVCTEANSVKGAEAADFFFYCTLDTVNETTYLATHGGRQIYCSVIMHLRLDQSNAPRSILSYFIPSLNFVFGKYFPSDVKLYLTFWKQFLQVCPVSHPSNKIELKFYSGSSP